MDKISKLNQKQQQWQSYIDDIDVCIDRLELKIFQSPNGKQSVDLMLNNSYLYGVVDALKDCRFMMQVGATTPLLMKKDAVKHTSEHTCTTWAIMNGKHYREEKITDYAFDVEKFTANIKQISALFLFLAQGLELNVKNLTLQGNHTVSCYHIGMECAFHRIGSLVHDAIKNEKGINTNKYLSWTSTQN